jgi:Mrp family chromosome partitioning ATPase
VTVGLAAALSNRGWPVAVVSGDLRRPVVERILGVPEVPGLGEYLAASGPHVGPMLVSVGDNLRLLPAGWAVRSPEHLLASPHLAQAVAQLRDLELVVLLDTPAARWWSDALTLAAEADATLLVARSGRSRWKSLAELAGSLRRDRFPVLGVVLVGSGRRRGAPPTAGTRAPRRHRRGAAEPEPLGGGNGHGHGNGHGSLALGGDLLRRPGADPPD